MKKAFFILFAFISVLALSQVPQRFNKVIVTGDITSPKFIKTGSNADSVLLGNGSARSVNSLKTDTVSLSNRINAKATGNGTANGTNTGDETLTSIKTKLGAATAVSDGYLKYQDYIKFDGKLSSEVDGSTTNELQTISTTGAAGNITLSNSGGTLNLNVNDADASTTNEIQDLSLSGNTLSLSSDVTTVDISQATAVLANTAKVTNATHTGDVTGSTALTLATVNSNIGTFNNVTINAKGLATAGSNVSYEPAFSKNTGFNKNFGTTPGTVLEGRTFGTAANSAVGDFIQNKNSSAQSANLWITGVGTIGDRLYIGSNSSADNSGVLVARSLTGSNSTGFHGFRDETTYNGSGGSFLAYACYDGITTFNGGEHYNHLNVFQARPAYNGSGLIDAITGVESTVSQNGTGVLDLSYSYKAMNALGAGKINYQYGLFIDNLTRGTSGNFAIFSVGNTQSYHQGLWQTGSDIIAAGKLKGSNFYYNQDFNSVAVGNAAPATNSIHTTVLGGGAATNNTGCNFSTIIGANAGYSGSGSSNIFLGNQAGYYETGSNKLIIDNQQGTDEANARTRAMFYGVFNSNPSLQTLNINASVTAPSFIGSGSNLTGVQLPITLTTNGTSGAATFSGNVLNVPNYNASSDVYQERTTVNGSTSGYMICSMPFRTGVYKKVLIRTNSLNGSATYTFPTSFLVESGIGPYYSIHTTGGSVTVSSFTRTSITLSSAVDFSAYIVVEGY